MLGLQGAVQDQDFEALRQGLDPRTGEFIRQRQGSDRVGKDGATQSQARHLYDFTFSAPKSVSVMAILGGETRLREAHTEAVAVALAELEDHACARVRQGGANSDRHDRQSGGGGLRARHQPRTGSAIAYPRCCRPT